MESQYGTCGCSYETPEVGGGWTHPPQDEKCIARKAMEWNPIISAGRLLGRPRETCRRTVARESKVIGKSWNELKALAHNRKRWKTGVIDFLCPPWDRG